MKPLGPRDSCNCIYWICFLEGCGVLLSYNLLLTCADYFTAELPNHPQIMFYVVPASAFTQVIFLIVMILCGESLSFTSRIVNAFLISAVGIGITPIFVHRLPENVSFWIVLGISSFIGITTAIVQASIVGLMNYLPSSYVQVSFAGQAVSGITACIIRIITKFYHIYGGISDEEGGIVYFVTGAAFNVICAMAFLYLFQSSFTQYWLRQQSTTEIGQSVPIPTSPERSNVKIGSVEPLSTFLLSPDSRLSNLHDSLVGAVSSDRPNDIFPKPMETASYKKVLQKIWKIAFAVFLVFYVTLLMFSFLFIAFLCNLWMLFLKFNFFYSGSRHL